MPDEPVPTPQPLIQDPEEAVPKPVFLAKKEDPTQIDVTKVMAAVGLILTLTIIIVGLLWISLQNLEQRVAELEVQEKTIIPVNKKTASEAAALLANKAASKSATVSSGR